MSRKLRNSMNALIVTSALCATGAFAAAAIPFHPSHATASVPASAVVVAAIDSMPVNDLNTSRRVGNRSSRIRHALAMPYFSFVPRG